MKSLTPLTAEQIKRAKNEIINTERMLNKELSINNDLQYSDKIEFLKNHIIHLNNMIVNGWNAPKLN